MKNLLQLMVIASGVMSFLLANAQDVPSSGQTGQNVKARGQSSNLSSGGSAGNTGTGIFNQSDELGEETSVWFNDWSESVITLKDKSVLTDRLIRYNLLTRQMEFIHGDDTAAIGNPDEIAFVGFADHKFIYTEFLNQNNTIFRDYLEVLVEGKCSLLLHRTISHRYIEETPGSIMDSPKERYYLAENFYISKNGSLPIPLPGKKKDIIGLLTEKDLKSYIREHNLKCDHEGDLIELISFYNEE
ncbi:MAG: hypothetical protein FJY07_11685 [Bacteroidetes bacterium]|nr:hypothetical protein [Bacteroidota bacterium]